MVLDDPIQAIGVAAIVFFVLLGILYLRDLKLPEKRWFGIIFLLVGVTILLFLAREPGLGGVTIATIGAMAAKRQLDRRGIVSDTRTFGRTRT
jgi:hypothetical protein